MKRRFIIIFLLLALSLSACAQKEAAESMDMEEIQSEELTPIRLPMGYIPNVQFAPWYVAVEKGYFSEAGFDVTFDYSYETDIVELVGANEIPFGVASAEQVLLARTQNIPIVYTMTWFQGFPTAVVAKAETGVETPEDLAGQKIGLPILSGASYIGLRALLNSGGVAESDVTLDVIGFNQVQAMVGDQEDIVVGYVTNEPVQLRALGYDVNVISVDDYLELPANGLITNESVISENPEMVEAFVQAFMQGLVDTLADPDEAFELCKAHVENLAELDEKVQKEVLSLSLDYWKADTLGYSQQTSWENLQELLLDMELIVEPLVLSEAYTNQFVE